jgi:hypothetical protein
LTPLFESGPVVFIIALLVPSGLLPFSGSDLQGLVSQFDLTVGFAAVPVVGEAFGRLELFRFTIYDADFLDLF